LTVKEVAILTNQLAKAALLLLANVACI